MAGRLSAFQLFFPGTLNVYVRGDRVETVDRIAALSNIEDALSAFESGEADLASTEERVLAVLRTYATAFETGDLAAYRARGEEAADGLVVVAESREQARHRVRNLLDGDVEFTVERQR